MVISLPVVEMYVEVVMNPFYLLNAFTNKKNQSVYKHFVQLLTAPQMRMTNAITDLISTKFLTSETKSWTPQNHSHRNGDDPTATAVYNGGDTDESLTVLGGSEFRCLATLWSAICKETGIPREKPHRDNTKSFIHKGYFFYLLYCCLQAILRPRRCGSFINLNYSNIVTQIMNYRCDDYDAVNKVIQHTK